MDLPFGDLMSREVLSGVPLIAAGSDDDAFGAEDLPPGQRPQKVYLGAGWMFAAR